MYISALYSPGKMGGPPPGLMQVVAYPKSSGTSACTAPPPLWSSAT